MKNADSSKLVLALPYAVAVIAAGLFLFWLASGPGFELDQRKPGADAAPAGAGTTSQTNPVYLGKLTLGEGRPADTIGAWPRFRGAKLDGISTENTPLARTWPAEGPKVTWALEVGEGYAGAAVQNGRVYVMDYDHKNRQDALRCLSLADGKEIWRYAYPNQVKRNHGMSRTVPTLTDKLVIAMGPKCHVVCLDAATGELRWGLDLVRQFGATVPEWYAGQCPLVDEGKLVLAVGGKDCLFVAVDVGSGKVLWQSPNPRKWKMTHSSVMPMEFAGQRSYVYCANLGVVGISASDGKILWDTTDWKVSLATVPSPVVLDGGRIFLSGGYNAGSLMLQLTQDGDRIVPEKLFKLAAKTFGATQQTPIFREGHFFGVREPDSQFVCLDANGKMVWSSGPAHKFGLGSFLMANDLIYALNDSGRLKLIEANTKEFKLLAEAQVLNGPESWAPMALAGGRLIARNSTRMVCLEVGQ